MFSKSWNNISSTFQHGLNYHRSSFQQTLNYPPLSVTKRYDWWHTFNRIMSLKKKYGSGINHSRPFDDPHTVKWSENNNIFIFLDRFFSVQLPIYISICYNKSVSHLCYTGWLSTKTHLELELLHSISRLNTETLVPYTWYIAIETRNNGTSTWYIVIKTKNNGTSPLKPGTMVLVYGTSPLKPKTMVHRH